MPTLTEPTADVQGEARLSVADQLRKLADWLDAHDIPERDVIEASVHRSLGPWMAISGHEHLRRLFAGQSAQLERGAGGDMLSVKADGIRFRGWSNRPEASQKEIVTL